MTSSSGSPRVPTPTRSPSTLPGGANGIFALPMDAPSDVVNFGRVDALPAMLGGLVAFVAASMLAHTLLSAVRRRRRDLALLKTLGLIRRQLGTVVRWQALTLVAIAARSSGPRSVWPSAGSPGAPWPASSGSSVPVVPTLGLVLLAAAAVGIALLASAFPARSAARTPPAEVLRSS